MTVEQLLTKVFNYLFISSENEMNKCSGVTVEEMLYEALSLREVRNLQSTARLKLTKLT